METDPKEKASKKPNATEYQKEALPIMPPVGSYLSISSILESCPEIDNKLKPFHPIKSAGLVAGLLTEPSLHANNLRLEMLIHLLVAYASGECEPKTNRIRAWLNTELGETALALNEDPVEDVYISNVITDEGNFRIFEGRWESNDFYLQRILNVCRILPDDSKVRQLSREIHAILRLSEAIVERRQLARFTLGSGQDKRAIQMPTWGKLNLLRKAIEFSRKDLEDLDIAPGDLDPFILEAHSRDKLKDQEVGDSDLESKPIICDGNIWYVLLPCAISYAVRKHVLDWGSLQGYQEAFDNAFTMEYQRFLRETPILGSSYPYEQSLPSRKIDDKHVLEFASNFDTGRYVQVIAIVDGIDAYVKHKMTNPDPEDLTISEKINQYIKQAHSIIREREDFKEGLTLVIGCGYGRGLFFGIKEPDPDWLVEAITAPDIQTLSLSSEESPMSLWKIAHQKRLLAQSNISIYNGNGLLNLYGYWQDTDFMMLDHRTEFGAGAITIVLSTDYLTDVRVKTRQGWDIHALPLQNGKHIPVRRYAAKNYFSEDHHKPIYGSIEAARSGNLLGAWVGKSAIWWIAAEYGNTGISQEMVFRIWDAAIHWIDRAGPIIEKEIREQIDKPILICLDFDEANTEPLEPSTESEVRSSLSVSIDSETQVIEITISETFIAGSLIPKNIAESILIRTIAKGVLLLSDRKPSDETLDSLLEKIVPNEDARYLHLFQANSFRDYIQSFDSPESFSFDEADTARTRLGLGWLVQKQRHKNEFKTPDESSSFLNDVVAALWKRIREKLRGLDRVDLINQALRSLEGNDVKKKQWDRTLRAVLSLHEDHVTTREDAFIHMSRYSNSNIALRILIEMALSTSPLDGGKAPGALDIIPLISDVFAMVQFGGWSDAIKKEVKDPIITIAPSGDVQSHVEFQNEIMEPLFKKIESNRLDQEIDQYEKNFEPSKPILSAHESVPADYLEAFEDEFGLSIDALRGVRDSLENLGIKKKKCVYIAREDEILNCCENEEFSSKEVASVVLERFALEPRDKWEKAPEEFRNSDLHPWRYGRKLSLVARPIVKLEDCDNPRYMVSPGLIAQSVPLTITRYSSAKLEACACNSSKMKSWIDKEKNRQGHAFEAEVFEFLKALGYEARLGNTLGSLLNEKQEKNLGDVDVIAWKTDDNNVFIIECKDLNFAKTPNEIAEQLNRFSGQTLRNGKRDNLLKHLDRCTALRNKSERLAKTIGMADTQFQCHTVICFSNPVPMQYVAERFPDVLFITIDQLRGDGLKQAISSPSRPNRS